MKVFKLMIKNALRHKLRSLLTIVGISVALVAFGLLRTVVTAWNAGIDASQADRLITRHSVSFIFPLDYAYRDKIARVPGVINMSFASWFGGVYIDKSQFFARMAVEAETFFDVYSEYLVTTQELSDFKKERNACIIGEGIARQYNIKIGDIMPLEGDIYPGKWEFVVRGIYRARDKTTDTSQMLFQWEYLNQRMEQESPGRANEVGWYIIKVDNPTHAADISALIDEQFVNSSAETKTETERAFAQGFLASTGAILTAMNVMSFLIVGIIMLVLANTMIMSARERTREYAVFKALGFSGSHLLGLIMGESLLISALGGGLGIFLLFPVIAGFEQAIPKGIFPVFQLEPITLVLSLSAVLFIGIAAALLPVQRALTTRIIDGFRFVG